jgi:hypothetical protein
MTVDTSAFEREMDGLEGNARAETKKELIRLSVVCKGQPDELITRKLKKVFGPKLAGKDLASMVATLKTGDKITLQ